MRTDSTTSKHNAHRQRIIDATEQHVLTKGFHKASMSDIAKSADLSVGQIYRYFSHKDDIICALVEQGTQQRLQFMEHFLDKKNWLSRFFSEDTAELRNMRILSQEIMAEAARNPTIATICQRSHQRLQARALEILQKRYPSMEKQDAISRIEMLSTLTEGLLVRWDYQTRPFTKETHLLYAQMLDNILPEA